MFMYQNQDVSLCLVVISRYYWKKKKYIIRCDQSSQCLTEDFVQIYRKDTNTSPQDIMYLLNLYLYWIDYIKFKYVKVMY